MTKKIISLCVSLFVLASIISFSLGAIDIFGFLDGRHTLSTALLLSIVISQFLLVIVVFLIDISPLIFKKKVLIYSAASFIFGVIFFILTGSIWETLLTSVLFFNFQILTTRQLAQRLPMYTSFNPKELFSPVMRSALFTFLIFFCLIAYTQSKQLVEKRNLVQPQHVIVLSHPIAQNLNKQISSYLKDQLSSLPPELDERINRTGMIRLILAESLGQLKDKDNKVYGIDYKLIPIEKATVYENGDVDLTPVIVDIAPLIALSVNAYITHYSALTPFIIALIVFIILQTFTLPLQLVEVVITSLVMKLLTMWGVIKIEKIGKQVDIVTT